MTTYANVYIVQDKNDLMKIIKDIHIPIHGRVSISLMAKYFIDSKYFQRLHELRQLATCNKVFPSATHTRFEHSIGTYYLADRLLNRIKLDTAQNNIVLWLYQNPLLNIYFNEYVSKSDDGALYVNLNDYDLSIINTITNKINWIFELIRIGALCHDIGHGPFSHAFDDVFIKKSDLRDHLYAAHEARSCKMIELITNESEILRKNISESDIKFIQTIIDPDETCEGFVYHIVSNNLNGLDVDKYDYIARDNLHLGLDYNFNSYKLIDSSKVLNNKITYDDKYKFDILDLFQKRHRLHKIAYGHKSVISSLFLTTDLMKILDKVIDISKSILDMNVFINMTDEYIIQYIKIILQFQNAQNNPFANKLTVDDYDVLKKLYNRYQIRDLYTHIGTILTKEQIIIDEHFNDPTHIIHYAKNGYVSGNKTNPMNNIYTYKAKDLSSNNENVECNININDISYIVPEIYQEYIAMVICRDKNYDKILQDKQKIENIKIIIRDTLK